MKDPIESQPGPKPVPGGARRIAVERAASSVWGWGLFLIAIAAVLYIARPLFIPIAGAMLLALLFQPTVRKLDSWGIPRALSATVIMAVVSAILLFVVVSIGNAVSGWIEEAPETMERLEQRVRSWKKPLAQLNEATSGLEKLAEIPEGMPLSDTSAPILVVSDGYPPGAIEAQPEPANDGSSNDLLGKAFASSLTVITSFGICIVMTLFLLTSGPQFSERIASGPFPPGAGERIAGIVHEVETGLSCYLRARTLINLLLGLVLWPVFHYLGMPGALLWATGAALLNFIPYMGSAILAVLIFVAAVMVKDTLVDALIVPAAYAAINAVEGMVLSPLLLGRSLKLNPLSVFVAVLMGGWFWGIAGALMAVPLLVAAYLWMRQSATTKVIAHMIAACDDTEDTAVDTMENLMGEEGAVEANT